MIVLDTNVISELMKGSGSAAVSKWIAAQGATRLMTTAITQAEILHGIALLPAGRRRREIQTAADAMFNLDFADRILPFDSRAAVTYAALVRERQRRGRPIGQFDAQIAAIALVAQATLATHNVRDFEHCDLDVVDPWAAG